MPNMHWSLPIAEATSHCRPVTENPCRVRVAIIRSFLPDGAALCLMAGRRPPSLRKSMGKSGEIITKPGKIIGHPHTKCGFIAGKFIAL